MIGKLIGVVVCLAAVSQREILLQLDKWPTLTGSQLISFNAAYQELCKQKLTDRQKDLENYKVRFWTGKEHHYISFAVVKIDPDEEIPVDAHVMRHGVNQVYVVSIKTHKVERSW